MDIVLGMNEDFVSHYRTGLFLSGVISIHLRAYS